MELTGEARAEGYFVHVNASRIDAAGAIQFKDDFRDTVGETEGRIILNLTQVDFLDSSGLGAVVAAMKHLGSGRKLDLVGLSPTVSKVFRLTRMDSVFQIYPDIDAAIAAGAEGATNG